MNRCKQEYSDISINIGRDITSILPQPMQYTLYYIGLH